MKNTSISERLVQAIDFVGVNANDFAKKLGYNRSQAIYDMINGKSKPSFDFFEKVLNSEYSELLNIEWLISGKGGMAKNGVNEPNAIYSLRTDKIIDEQSVPLYDLAASAGVVSLFRDNADTKPVDFISIPNLPKCDGAIYVTGDSMHPLLKSGDIVMYRQLNGVSDGFIWGEMYIISYEYGGDEMVSVKFVKRSDKGGNHIKLVSYNHNHDDMDVELTKVRNVALVKASIRINSMG